MKLSASTTSAKRYSVKFATTSARRASKLWYFFGAATFRCSSPGHMAFPRSLLQHALSWFPGIQVVPTDEFRTSLVCSKCRNSIIDGPAPRSSWRLKACSSCHVIHNRDVNAADNILYVGREMNENGGVRPGLFRRGEQAQV